jgi:hypothetical protein
MPKCLAYVGLTSSWVFREDHIPHLHLLYFLNDMQALGFGRSSMTTRRPSSPALLPTPRTSSARYFPHLIANFLSYKAVPNSLICFFFTWFHLPACNHEHVRIPTSLVIRATHAFSEGIYLRSHKKSMSVLTSRHLCLLITGLHFH